MSEENKIDWNAREIGALWKKNKNGQNFYSGKFTYEGKEVEVVCFTNKHKTSDTHPDVRIYLSGDPKPSKDPII